LGSKVLAHFQLDWATKWLGHFSFENIGQKHACKFLYENIGLKILTKFLFENFGLTNPCAFSLSRYWTKKKMLANFYSETLFFAGILKD
jgi:hypothetical protein